MEYIGYKIMGFEDDGVTIKSGANSSLKYQLSELEDGKTIKMPGNGCYLGMSKEYVLDYYSGLAEKEILLVLKFNSSDIITGDINDLEPELSLSNVLIMESYLIEDSVVTSRITKKENTKIKRLRPRNF